METKTETYQEALDFVKEMLNATEPNVMNNMTSARTADKPLTGVKKKKMKKNK